MRTILLLSWLTLPIAGVAYHYGPGQDRLQLDDVAIVVAAADRAAAAGDWHEAVEQYSEAIKQLPAGHKATAQRLRLERCKAQMNDSALPAAASELSTLVDEVAGDGAADEQLSREARRALANAQFYMTWLLRLEGKGRAEWEPQIEAARQNFRHLAETADTDGRTRDAARGREDLETAVRLERLQIEDLQGLPLPSQ